MTFRTEVQRLSTEIGKLIEEHEHARDISEFSRYADDPLGFIREELNWDPWEAQEEIAEAVLGNPLTVVRSANSIGKDALAARLAIWWAVARRGLTICTGPTERQIRQVLFKEIRQAWHKDLPGKLFEQELRVDRESGAGIVGFTSTEAGRLTGFHAPLVLGIVTEGQSTGPHVLEALLSCAVGDEDRLLVLGNPLHPSGEFYRISQPGSGWHSIRIPASRHPNIAGGRHIPGGVTRTFVENIKSQYGERSSIYRSRVEAEFPAESAYGMFNRELLEASVHADVGTDGELVAAIDPARFGNDASVLAIRRGGRLTRLEEWSKLSTTETSTKATGFLLNAGFDVPGRVIGQGGYLNTLVYDREARGTVIVDSIGVGAGVADQLRDRGLIVREFKAGRSARRKQRFGDLRSEAAWHLRELLEEGHIRLPQHEELFVELLAHEWFADGSGRVQLEPKDKIRDRLGRSPDYADAVCMLFSDYKSASSVPNLPNVYW